MLYRIFNFNSYQLFNKSVITIAVILLCFYSCTEVNIPLSDIQRSDSPLISVNPLNRNPVTFKFDSTKFISLHDLNVLKVNYLNQDPDAIHVVQRIIDKADSLFSLPPPSVTEKEKPAPSGSYNDYVSLARYWWPNPDSLDGPYIRRDGKTNPEINIYNRDELARLRGSLFVFAKAYHITRNEIYVNAAIEYLEVWFLNPETKMSPHLSYAQFIPGVNEGRFIGIIDGLDFARILDAVALLKHSVSWDERLENGLANWYSEYFNWILNSEFGKSERDYYNNHGSWYDVQVLSYATSLRKKEFIYRTLDYTIDKRISPQIAPDGAQTFEINRANSLHYSLYNLEALLIIAEYGKTYDVNLWNYPSEGKSSLKKAIQYLEPYYFTRNKSRFIKNEGITQQDICRYKQILKKAYILSEDIYFENLTQQLMIDGCIPENEFICSL